MPLNGPRANPSSSQGIYSAQEIPAPSYSSLDHSYPHQSSPESGTARLEPTTRPTGGESEAQEVMRDYRMSNSYNDEGDVGLLAPSRSQNDGYGYGYNNPYEEDHQHPPRSISPSLGPWDSASQRSLPFHPNQFPSQQYQPSHVPLSELEDGSGPMGQGHRDKAPSYGGLSYIDENGEYYQTNKPRPASTTLHPQDEVEMGLIGNTNRSSGGIEPNPYYSKDGYGDSPYPYPTSLSKDGNGGGMRLRGPNTVYDFLLFPTGLDRLLALFGVRFGQYPIEQAIERKRRGIGGQRWPVASWGLAIVMTALMVYEMVANYQAMGSPIATKPSFNPMIGPSAEVLINIGARFPPCMKYVEDLPPTFQLACLNDTANPPTTACSIEEICGHGGFNGQNPDQSWRFVYPIFLHVGIVHLLLNMLAQIIAGAQVEREMGTIPFLIVYMAGGIYGFVLGGNFSRTGIPSVGASGALFASNACVLVDLVLHWKYEERPKLKAFLLAIEFWIGFGIGYIPNAVDGLAHLGGWALGILLGIILYPSISESKRHKYAVWVARVIAFVLVILAFVLTIKNFYTDDPNAACEWCRYLSCIPTSSNEHCKGTGITVTNTSSTRRSWDSL
ncbi:hypothetical protein I302_101213 [Kwoniella bestiolae CBS 10118]|uniref:Rhomboid-type serine protease n=1 Tax=Kwoniella bestiolae CBS 10118 TaxID=1296100 RepID=A0A1B9G7A0_9TREE|nr:rhomboid family membrane protein [Kwoniella bestiolae CBS 10118]OCF26896.1 rhomboid family membrane protein [Kwoniella bestiolae CBS 10118]